MKIIDISWPITPEMTGYKNNHAVTIHELKNFDAHGVRETALTINAHAGTHIDAPSHFLKDGKTGCQMDITNGIGPCIVLDLTDCIEVITDKDVQKYDALLDDHPIILLKTSNSNLYFNRPFCTDFVYLDTTAAEYLTTKNIQLVGIDYLGIERNQPNHETHTTLMNANITIVEGLRLKNVTPGEYFFICLGLKIMNTESAPARAILIKQ